MTTTNKVCADGFIATLIKYRLILLAWLATPVIILVRLFGEIVVGFYYRWLKKVPRTSLPPVNNVLLLQSASSLAAQIRSRQVKCEDVVRCFVARIAQVNPMVNAVVGDRFQDALKEARRVDIMLSKETKSEAELAKQFPLLGVPFTVKEHLGVKGLRCSAGIPARRNSICDEDCDVVKLMRQVGAIPLGTTNCSEAGLSWSCTNGIYGETKNPYDSNRIPGGSSGGEGCIISCCGSVIGIGSDLGGSVRIPAAFNGIFSHKPTAGIVTLKGMFPINLTGTPLMTIGPLCRYAEDLWPMLKIMAGKNISKLTIREKIDLHSIKLYYREDFGGFRITSALHPDIRKIQQQVLKYFQTSFNVEPKEFSDKRLKHSLWVLLFKLAELQQEMGMGMDYVFSNNKKDYQRILFLVSEFLRWTVGKSEHTFTLFPIALAEYLQSFVSSNATLPIVLAKLKKEFEECLGSNGIFLFPTYPDLPPYTNQYYYLSPNVLYTAMFNLLEFPATHCTLGVSEEGMPIGLQVVSTKYNDQLCIAVAQLLEKEFGGWRNPASIKTLLNERKKKKV